MKTFELSSFVHDTLIHLNHISEILKSRFSRAQYQGLQISEDVETLADQAVAQLWVNFLTKLYPDFNIDTEEALGKIQRGSDFTILIDSIDGSKHFRAGIPLFTSNISLRYQGQTLFSACTNPLVGDIYHAILGSGAFLNGQLIRVSQVDKLSHAFIAVEGPTSNLLRDNETQFSYYESAYNRLVRNSFRVRNFGLGGLSLCLVACGACAAYVDLSTTTKPYDIEAGILILKEAGGLISSLKEETINMGSAPFVLVDSLVSSNGYIHKEIVAVLTQAT